LRYCERQKLGVRLRQHDISAGHLPCVEVEIREIEVREAKRLRALEEENLRLQRLMADQAVQIHNLKEINAKK
jgi:putative transposase